MRSGHIFDDNEGQQLFRLPSGHDYILGRKHVPVAMLLLRSWLRRLACEPGRRCQRLCSGLANAFAINLANAHTLGLADTWVYPANACA